jgi:hypothetical protein
VSKPNIIRIDQLAWAETEASDQGCRLVLRQYRDGAEWKRIHVVLTDWQLLHLKQRICGLADDRARQMRATAERLCAIGGDRHG